MSIKCPRCANEVPSLSDIDAGLMAKLQEAGQSGLPSSVCLSCFTALAGSVARGSVLLAHEKAKEQHKLMLWKSRVGMIKTARNFMAAKSYSDAAVVYEKYVRVLEVIFDSGPGGLKPEHFKDSARTQELTVLASVYWDLIRIYDTSANYGDRMRLASQKLSQLLKFTPIYPDILRKAEAFQKSAKNPAVIKSFLKSASESKGRCFIASSVFESADADEVLHLRLFRDLILENSAPGKAFIRGYYRWSPAVAFWLDRKPKTRRALRSLLIPMAKGAELLTVSTCHSRVNGPKSSENEHHERNQAQL